MKMNFNLLMLLSFSLCTISQSINAQTSDIPCDSLFRDSGGFQVPYANNEDVVYTICPDNAGSSVTLTFTFVDIAVNEFSEGNQGGCWDFLTIYNGPDTLSPVIAATLCGEVSQSGQSPSDLTSLLLEGDEFTSTDLSGCLAVRFRSDDIIVEEGWEALVTCSSIDSCSVFDTAPVDLTKSFDPVNGIQDRVQVKWYKESPTVKYSDSDAAACDIKFWAKRNLDPISGNPMGDVITDPDTLLIEDAKKSYPDNSPKSIFKWPVKFRADGANNAKRVDPNIRYEWQVRCACEHGLGQESPWSDIKIFNTPDFNPSTGIYGIEGEIEQATRSIEIEDFELLIYPSPSAGDITVKALNAEVEASYEVQIVDVNGRVVFKERTMGKQLIEGQFLSLSDQFESGIYSLIISSDSFYSSAVFSLK